MRSLLLFVLVFTVPFCALAQTGQSADTLSTRNKQQRKPFVANISFFNQSVSIPFHKIISNSFHPGAQAGIEGRYFETAHSKLFQTLNLGMFYNKYNGTGFYMNSELAYRYTSKFRISAETLLGIGYLRTYHPSAVYEANDNGIYQKVSGKGLGSGMYSLAVGLAYHIKSSNRYSFAPFIRYQALIQTPYSEDFDVFPQTMFHVGIRIIKQRLK